MRLPSALLLLSLPGECGGAWGLGAAGAGQGREPLPGVQGAGVSRLGTREVALLIHLAKAQGRSTSCQACTRPCGPAGKREIGLVVKESAPEGSAGETYTWTAPVTGHKKTRVEVCSGDGACTARDTK